MGYVPDGPPVPDPHEEELVALSRAYLGGFIDEGMFHRFAGEVLGLPTKSRRELPIYCPPEYYWRECECGRQGQQTEGQ